MIIEQKATPVEVNGGGSHSNFSIAFNSKAFRVLSDTLYANKAGSIIRELSCNAQDSHIMAGKSEVPFIIHLPDSFEPWFSVQDQGVGLSPEDISNVFTVYFQSTKDQSNECTGMLGLGSKSPFSYTDQFTVTSVKHGLRTIYNAFINEQGIPNIVEMFSEETTEGNGVEIKLSVKREDYSKFASEVKNQLQYFKVKPTVLNTSIDLFDSEPEYLFNTSAVSIEPSSTGYYGTKAITALQGNVGYTLDMDQLRGKINPENYLLLTNLYSNKTLLKFNIGEIGVTASREGVEYTAATLKNISDKITLARQQIDAEVQSKLTKEFTTDYQRLAYLNNNPVARYFALSINVTNSEKNSAEWFFDLRKYLITDNKTTGTAVRYNRHDTHKRKRFYQPSFVPSVKHNQFILFKDKSSLCTKKIHQFFNTNPNVDSIYVVEFFDKQYSKEKQEQLEKFLGGFYDITYMSDIVLPVAVYEKQKSQSRVAKYYAYNKLIPYSEVRSYEKVFTDLSDIKVPTVYFVVENLVPMCAHNLISDLQDLSTLINVLPVIAVRESAVEKLKQNSLFIPLSKYIADKKQELGTEEVKRVINRKYIVDAVNGSIPYSLVHKKELITKNCPNNEITRLFKTLDKQKSIKQYSLAMNRFIGYQPSADISTRSKATKAADVVKNILKKYQVVSTLGNTYHGKEISDQHLIVYLNAVQSYLQK